MSASIVAEHAPEAGGNRRFAVRLDDGAEVEAVLYRGDTLCISSQVGCAVRCPFCASGANGLTRGLSFEELVAQVELVAALGVPVARLTVSGVGEPLHNHVPVLRLVRWAHARDTPASLTTSGGPLARLAEWLGEPTHNGLTLSVHAGTEPVRARLVPHAPALEPLFSLLAERVPSLPRRRRKKLALAYLALDGDNDDDAELDAFAARVRAIDPALTVHLYAHNAVPTSDRRGVSRARYEAMYERLVRAGLERVRMSSRARLEPNGGCGTLVALRQRPLPIA